MLTSLTFTFDEWSRLPFVTFMSYYGVLAVLLQMATLVECCRFDKCALRTASE